MIQVIIGTIIGLLAGFAAFFIYRRLFEKQTRTSFDDLSRKALQDMMPSLLDIAKRELGIAREEINKDVLKERNIVADVVEKVEKSLKEKYDEIKRLEQDRNRQFGSIRESIKMHQQAAEMLSEKAENLSKILSSNKLRGNWGERLAEDILQYAGFKEGPHYAKQKKSGNSGTIPDFTIFLPNGRKINIDAKFPFANLRLYQETSDNELKKKYLTHFKRDVKEKVREITTRDYINEDEGTLDYVILFVPSDIVYGFINERFPDIVDDAFRKRVLLTSPTSFFATLRIIMESYRHFMYEKNIREVLKIIQSFIDNFKRFKQEFSVFDDAIKKLRKSYDQIAETRYKKMDVQIRRIEKLERIGDTVPKDEQNFIEASKIEASKVK